MTEQRSRYDTGREVGTPAISLGERHPDIVASTAREMPAIQNRPETRRITDSSIRPTSRQVVPREMPKNR